MSRPRPARAARRALRVCAAALVVAGIAAPAASADFGIHDVELSATPTQAGARADFRAAFSFNTLTPVLPDGGVKHVRVSLPPGLVGDPSAVPQCDPFLFTTLNAPCPVETQVGVVQLTYTLQDPNNILVRNQAVYNLPPEGDTAAAFGFNVSSAPNVEMVASVRGDDFGLDTDVANINQSARLLKQDMTLWGSPADPSHDGDRGLCLYSSNLCPSAAPPRGFMRNPTRCDADLTATVSVASWQHPEVFRHTPVTLPARTGCEDVPFEPEVTITPKADAADAPSGLDVELKLPQTREPGEITSSDLRDAVVTLPKGWSMSPSAAAGLEACDDDGIGIGNADPVDCPVASRVGTATIDTPLLEKQLQGPIIVGPSPSLGRYRIYVVAEGQGVRIKLRGEIVADAKTGQLTTSFLDSPEQPFSRFALSFDAGDRAVLASPAVCAKDEATVALTPWSSSVAKTFASTLAFPGSDDCAPRPFTPTFSAGVSNAKAGAATAFSLQIGREDRTQEVGAITTISMPKGLVADVGSVPLCAAARAATGDCPAASQVGRTETLSGPGPRPLGLTGKAYLTEGYRGAPYGLAMVIPAVAGPYDLGTVVVRSAIRIAPDAQVTVETDPLPTILGGVPLRMRSIGVVLDRPGFMLNPTSCAPSAITAGLRSIEGTTVDRSSRFQVGGCAEPGLQPKLGLSLSGAAKEFTDNGHPTLTARMDPRAGDANQKQVAVKLPLSLALDADNASGLCEPAAAAANACPASSIVGSAKALSILHEPLTAPVYFMRGERTDPKTGRVIKTLPKLFVPLNGNGVTIPITASSSVENNQLTTTFDELPDVPLRSFDLTINGGKNGILAVTNGDYCSRRSSQRAGASFAGQNGRKHRAELLVTSSCALGIVGNGRTRDAAKLAVTGISAGKLVLSGKGIVKTTRSIKYATVATVRTKLAAATRRQLDRGRSVKLTVKASFTPAGAKQAKTTTKTVVLRAIKKAKR